MKHTLFLIQTIFLSILTLLLVTSCQKDTLSKGLYYADTPDGLLYLELMSGHNCVMFFQGGQKSQCSYFISHGEIDLIGDAKIQIGSRTVSWWFGGSMGKGVINGNSFRIQGQRLYRLDPEYRYLTFYKH